MEVYLLSQKGFVEYKHNPTINDSKTEDGTGIGNYESSILGLNPSTTYYVRSYATNLSGTFYVLTVLKQLMSSSYFHFRNY